MPKRGQRKVSVPNEENPTPKQSADNDHLCEAEDSTGNGAASEDNASSTDTFEDSDYIPNTDEDTDQSSTDTDIELPTSAKKAAQSKKTVKWNISTAVEKGENQSLNKAKGVGTKSWTREETELFYKSLKAVGTDLELVKCMFPSRSLGEIKAKFSREQRVNSNLIKKVVYHPQSFDLSELQKRKGAKGLKEEKRKNTIKRRSLTSLGFDEEDAGPLEHSKKNNPAPKKSADNDHLRETEDSTGNGAASEDNASSTDTFENSDYIPNTDEDTDQSSTDTDIELPTSAKKAAQSKKTVKWNISTAVEKGENYSLNKAKGVGKKSWTREETKLFYKALKAVGTDLKLVKCMFPSRSLGEIKAKFSREERVNGNLIKKVVYHPESFDFSELEVRKGVKGPQKDKRKHKIKRRSLASLGFDEEDAGPSELSKKNKCRAASDTEDSTASDLLLSNTSKQIKRCLVVEKGQTHEEVSECLPHTSADVNKSKKGRTKKNSRNLEDVKTAKYGRRLPKLKKIRKAAETNTLVYLKGNTCKLDFGCEDEEKQKRKKVTKKPEETVESEENAAGSTTNNTIFQNAVPLAHASLDDIRPGSIVVVTAESPDNPGHHISNIFMVGPRSGNLSEQSGAINSEK